MSSHLSSTARHVMRVYDALQSSVSEASDAFLQGLVTAICRAVYFTPNTSFDQSKTKLLLFNVLRSASISVDDEQLNRIQEALQEYKSSIQDIFPVHRADQTSVRHDSHEALTLWNLESASLFDQLLLTSHAGSRHIEELPTPNESSAFENPDASSSSLPDTFFSPSWLRLRCASLASVKSGDLTSSEMALSVHNLLADQALSDEAIQGHLFDAFAGDFDAVAEVLTKRELVQKNADAILADCNQFAEVESMRSYRPSQKQRGVASRLAEPHDRGRMSTQLSIRDLTQETSSKDLERESRRLPRAGLLSSDEDPEFRMLQASLGGSSFEERSKAFPGVGIERDASIGAVDRTGLPKGSTRQVGKGYEEIFVPPPSRNVEDGNRVNVSSAFREHPELLQAMKGVTSLNRLQSAVYPVAFHSVENLLVCAPTGAGKTNVALLTIFREIVAVKTREQRSLKVVYVAPMKALAAEVTEKFSKRLSSLGIRVREFTGDMSLSRSEAMETDVLVTTPEKWDVVTRKSGSDLGNSVTLFIIDEIHLLHDDRGAVLESIVARTLRLSETAQRRIRLVGLSATLPNYADVGSFMRVDPHRGLFHFDGSHRPVPLSQTFIGISEGGSSNSNEARRRRQNKIHEMAWKKVKDSLQRGHQAMIFVHSRKGTSSAAREMLSRATQDACEGVFIGSSNLDPNFRRSNGSATGRVESKSSDLPVLPSWATKEISKAKSSDIRELCARGIGIHNAGLPRPDRKLVEKLFSEGVIRLLCCTATLAWGINLPARSVVIMGTEVYSAEKGGFVQLGMLDVMQIFGRAGRPQFDTEGEGTIITMHDHLSKYLSMLTSSIPIESQLGSSASRLADHLNAEVVSGTVSSVGEGVRWLSYTYLSVRMPQNPLVYGISRPELQADIGLHSHRAALIEKAAIALDDAQMCRYDPRTGALAPTDLGRISSHFYVSHQTVVMWNDMFSSFGYDPALTDQDWDELYATVIHGVSCATEFEQMRSRQEEAEELDQLAREACPLPLKAGSETREGKVAILFQAHISRAFIRMSDLSYVVESATRLLRAFFEISLRRGVPGLSLAALEVARASELRIWPFQHPLWQFTGDIRHGSGFRISPETVAMIESVQGDNSVKAMRAKTREELSTIIRSPKLVSPVLRILKSIPYLEIEEATIAPLTRSVLSITVSLFPNFRWNDMLHGKILSWWLWVEDLEENRVYHSQKIQLTKRQMQSLTSDFFAGHDQRKNTVRYEFTVPVFDPPSQQYWIRIESDRWHTGRESKCELSLARMDFPTERNYRSSLMDLRPLPLQAVFTEQEMQCFDEDITHLTPVQSQSFHAAYHSLENILLSGPYGSGMELIAYIAMLSTLKKRPSSMIVNFCSDPKALSLQRKQLEALNRITNRTIHVTSHQSSVFRPQDASGYSIMLTTPETWYRISRSWDNSDICNFVSLFVFSQLHLLLAEDEHTELILTRLRCLARNNCSSLTKEVTEANVPRIIAQCALVPNAAQLAEWLGVAWETGLFCFGPEVREVPCELQVLGVAGDRYSSRMYSLSRPLYAMIQRYSTKKPVLIFVSSRRQALLTAQDLLRMASLEGRKDFLGSHSAKSEIIGHARRAIKELGAQRLLSKGIALYHERLSAGERKAVEELFNFGYAQILISTFAMARGLDARSHQVIIKGTECYDRSSGRYQDVPVTSILQMLGRAGRARKDPLGYSTVFVHEPKKTLMKKILHEPLPIESRLLRYGFTQILNDLVSVGTIHKVPEILDWLSSTLMVRRLESNPGYYNMMKPSIPGSVTNRSTSGESKTKDADIYKNKFCNALVLHTIKRLELDECVTKERSHTSTHYQIFSEPLGHISAAHGIHPHSAKHIASHILKCETSQAVVDVLSGCDEVVGFEHDEVDDDGWKYLLDVVVTDFHATNRFKSKESVAQSLGISGWQESPMKRTRMLCYSVLVDRRIQSNESIELRQSIYERLRRLLNAAFDIAAEFGSLAALEACLRLSQSLYQGVPPYSDIWMLCGIVNEDLVRKGREQGWETVRGVLCNTEKFHVFLTNTCGSESERVTLSRRVQKFPHIDIVSSQALVRQGQAVVDVAVKATASHSSCDSRSRLTQKREGGYVLIASDKASQNVISVQRFAAPERRRVDNEKVCKARVFVPINEKSALVEKMRVWVASDVVMGVEAEAVLPVMYN